MEKDDPLKNLGMHLGANASVFKNARKLRNNLTPAETVLWNYLKQKPNGNKWRRQHAFGSYVLDFYCHKRKLSIELDGPYHDTPEMVLLDKSRTNSIRSMGVKELRFKNEEVLNDFDRVISSIQAALDDR